MNMSPKAWWKVDTQIWVRLTSKAELERNANTLVRVSTKSSVQLPPSVPAGFFLQSQNTVNISPS